MMKNMFAIFVALISLTSVWVGYKIDNSMKRKSEIEDSRINWIQKVREDNMKSTLLEVLEYE